MSLYGTDKILPRLIRTPGSGPKIYLSFNFSLLDYLWGATAGLYVGFQNGYITRSVPKKNPEGVSPFQDQGYLRWIRVLWEDPNTACIWRSLHYGIGGGFLHLFMRFLYKTLFCSEGSIVPVIGTYFGLAYNDGHFFANYRNLGTLLWYTCCYESVMMIIFKANSTHFVRHFLLRYLLRPCQTLFWPPKWV